MYNLLFSSSLSLSLLNSSPPYLYPWKGTCWLPPTDKPSEASVGCLCFLLPLFWYKPPHIRRHFFLIISPFMSVENPAMGLQNVNAHSSHLEKPWISTLQRDYWFTMALCDAAYLLVSEKFKGSWGFPKFWTEMVSGSRHTVREGSKDGRARLSIGWFHRLASLLGRPSG